MKRAADKSLVLSFGSLLLLASCARVYIDEYGEERRTRDREFLTSYAEEVFRRQNNASNQVALAEMGDTDPARLDRIYTAETAMIETCAPLNAMAMARRDGTEASLSMRLEVGRSLADCDRKARSLEQLLAKLIGPIT